MKCSIMTVMFAVQSTIASAVDIRCALTAGVSDHQARAGVCGFDARQVRFTGTKSAQVRCLLRTPTRGRNGLQPEDVPERFLGLIESTLPPSIALTRQYLYRSRIPEVDVGGALKAPILAEYLVIHDTSTPNCSERGACPVQGEFPPNLNDPDWQENITFNHHRAGGKPVAHVITNRVGNSLFQRDFKEHASHVKFDFCVDASVKKNLFVGIENVQPRVGDPAIAAPGKKLNDRVAPNPGFSDAQYERLALLYVVASTRRGHWLVPATHAVVDWYYLDGHDDPQNFEPARFCKKVLAIVAAIADPQPPGGSN